MIEDKQQRRRMPIKSPLTGDTVALMSEAGLEVWSKRIRRWEIYTIEELIQLHQDVSKPIAVLDTDNQTA